MQPAVDVDVDDDAAVAADEDVDNVAVDHNDSDVTIRLITIINSSICFFIIMKISSSIINRCQPCHQYPGLTSGQSPTFGTSKSLRSVTPGDLVRDNSLILLGCILNLIQDDDDEACEGREEESEDQSTFDAEGRNVPLHQQWPGPERSHVCPS